MIYLLRRARARRSPGRRDSFGPGAPDGGLDPELHAGLGEAYGDGGEPPPGRSARADVLLVAEREVRERLRGRAFRVVTLLILLVVAGAIVIPTLTKSKSSAEEVGLVAPRSTSEPAVVRAVGRAVGTRVAIRSISSRRAADAALRAGVIDLAVIRGAEVVVEKPIGRSDTSITAELARTLSQVLGQQRAYLAAGLTPAQIAAVSSPKALGVTSLQPAAPTSPQRPTTLVGIILIFVMLSQYNTWTLIGVMEEKSSRVVEVLLATIRPIQLLAGKVLGIGATVLAQAGLVVIVALGVGKVVGSGLMNGASPLVVVTSLAWLVLGYAFYCWVYAAAGSMAERQDQIQTIALPLSVPMIVGYILSLTVISSGNAPPWFEVLAYLPPTAPFAMPALVGLGVVSWWQVVLSAAVTAGATVGVAHVAAGVYRRAVLRTGSRVHLRDILGRSVR